MINETAKKELISVLRGNYPSPEERNNALKEAFKDSSCSVYAIKKYQIKTAPGEKPVFETCYLLSGKNFCLLVTMEKQQPSHLIDVTHDVDPTKRKKFAIRNYSYKIGKLINKKE